MKNSFFGLSQPKSSCFTPPWWQPLTITSLVAIRFTRGHRHLRRSKGPQLHECMSFRSGKSSHGHLEGVLEGFFEAAEKNVTSVFEV